LANIDKIVGRSDEAMKRQGDRVTRRKLISENKCI